MHLSRALLFVKDLDCMAAFYGAVLGLKPIEETRTDTWLEFDTGTTKFALHAIPPHIACQVAISARLGLVRTAPQN